MRILNIVECAYRATLEEQDDTVLWFVHMMRLKAGADVAVLLCGNAVNYLHLSQQIGRLNFGGLGIGNPPKIAEDIVAMIRDGIPVYYILQDAAERGLEISELEPGAASYLRENIPILLSGFDRIFHW